MRALIVLDGIWIAVLLVGAVFLYHEGAERGALREEAGRIRRELGLIERALERAEDAGEIPAGEKVPFSIYGRYLDGGGERLREKGLDPFGNAYGPQRPGGPLEVPAASAVRLGSVVDAEFWEPYRIAEPD